MRLINDRRRFVAAAMISLCSMSSASARELLHPMFQDHAVLQRDRSVRIWGDADPGAEVVVAIAGVDASTSTRQSSTIAFCSRSAPQGNRRASAMRGRTVPYATYITRAAFPPCPSRFGFDSDSTGEMTMAFGYISVRDRCATSDWFSSGCSGMPTLAIRSIIILRDLENGNRRRRPAGTMVCRNDRGSPAI